MEKKPVITFENFSFQYFSQAEPTLHDINLTIYEGEKVLLVGPSRKWKKYTGTLYQRTDSLLLPGRDEGKRESSGSGNPGGKSF